MTAQTKRLAPCPGSPNCVSSDAADGRHSIAPFRIRGDAGFAWGALIEALGSMKRFVIVEQTADYVHFEAKTTIFRFVDDVELELREDEGIIAVRSESRVGQWDLGVNRRRIERIRQALQERGVVE